MALSRHIAVDSVTAATVNATTINADTVNVDTVNAETVNAKNLKATGNTTLGSGTGTYEGKSAVALGWSRATDNGKAVIKLTGSANTEGKFSAGAGIGFQY